MTERSSYARNQENRPQTSSLDPAGDASEHGRLAQEVQRLRQETEQRNAELAIINSVQQGLSSRLELQAIYDLVGDKIRELFHNTDTEIRIYEPETNLFHVPYSIENGQRVAVDPIPVSDARMSDHVLRTGQTLVINENFVQELEKYGAKMVRGRLHHPKSGIFVPLMVGDQARGLIILSNVEREHAFNSSDGRLLQTLASSMSTALENARLFDETRRLLKDTEQQAAELAIINSVQEGLASKLDVQAIYDLVGNKIREVFKSESTLIALYDGKKNEIQFPYVIDETGKRFDQGPKPLSTGFSAQIIKTKVPLVINQDYEKLQAELGSRPFDPAHPPKAYLGVPMLVGQDVVGVVALSNLEENTFNDSDVRLLTTIANSMSVALENARLFDETQRLLKETEQRNAELAIINSVQEGLASQLDIQAIYDLVGDKIRDLFNAQSVWIVTFDQAARTRQFRYGFYRQRIYIPEPLPFNKLTEHLIATKKPLVINRDADASRAEFEMVIVPGSEMFKSAVFVPLIAGGEARGVITLQNMEQEEAFSESDINLLSTLAASMSVALENARLFDETQSLLKETEQRAAELAIINSVQEGLASQLDMQSIYDLVGDKIREIFQDTDAEIRIHDPRTNLLHFPYITDNGKRITVDPIPLTGLGLSSHVLHTGQTVVINENLLQEMEKYGSSIVPGGHPAKSAVFVPLMAGSQARGLIVLGNVEREHAFSPSDVRLFQTLASSMSTALENARLFDETQRLLKETEQRAAELQIINSVQAGLAEGLASRRDLQAIYDLVGDKIRELFPNTDTEIRVYDPKTDLFHVPYYIENGERSAVDPIALSDARMSAHVLQTGQTLVVNENIMQEMEKYGARLMLGRRVPARSAVFVPLMVGNQARGLIVLGNVEREGAFSPSDVRLLQTLANSMSTALENARLFDETQRLLKETEQRAAELAIINSVQHGLSSNLDMQAIYELVGDKMQEIFDAQSLLIIKFDRLHEKAYITYNRERDIRYYADPYPFTGLHRHLIQSGKTVVINEQAPEWQARFGMVLLPGTEVAKSMIFVPLISGNGVSGAISLQNLDREHAFSDMDVRLLETLASSMSVALENARLFDETQRLFLEAQEARTAAERADQAKSAFLSSMSHELRTPLNAIINFVEMVARGMIGPVNQEQVEILDQALYSSKHLLNLINDVLDISKIQAGQLTLFIEDQVSVQVEVEAALSIVGGLIQEKGLRLIRDIDPHLPLVACDRRRVRQVLLNLISNAIKFTQQGTVTVSVKDQGPEVLFAVIDTGPGIPPDKQQLIFEPFIQAENGDRQVHGTGLGLPISRSLVRAHGGELWVESQRGEGSAFFFSLPVEGRSRP